MAEGIRHGMTNAVIARKRGISADAVKFHVANILQKLGFSSRAELRRWDGVRRDSALAARRSGMMADLSLGPIGQIARSVKHV